MTALDLITHRDPREPIMRELVLNSHLVGANEGDAYQASRCLHSPSCRARKIIDSDAPPGSYWEQNLHVEGPQRGVIGGTPLAH